MNERDRLLNEEADLWVAYWASAYGSRDRLRLDAELARNRRQLIEAKAL